MRHKNLILTGFMGVGKSTVGPMLAQSLGRVFVDLDTWIEEQQGVAISTIFRDKGEETFRRLEWEACQHFASHSNLVLSTGGGTLLNPDCVEALQTNGLILCLTATLPSLESRLAGDQQRPLLRTNWKALLEERQPLYRSFPQVDTTGHSPQQVLEEIQRRWPEFWM